MYRPNHKFYKGWHHYYLGLIIMVVGFYLLFHVQAWVAILLAILGLYIACDDFYQHWRQNHQVGYHSPLHMLYVRIKKPLWLIWVNDKIDSILGKG